MGLQFRWTEAKHSLLDQKKRSMLCGNVEKLSGDFSGHNLNLLFVFDVSYQNTTSYILYFISSRILVLEKGKMQYKQERTPCQQTVIVSFKKEVYFVNKVTFTLRTKKFSIRKLQQPFLYRIYSQGI